MHGKSLYLRAHFYQQANEVIGCPATSLASISGQVLLIQLACTLFFVYPGRAECNWTTAHQESARALATASERMGHTALHTAYQ